MECWERVRLYCINWESESVSEIGLLCRCPIAKSDAGTREVIDWVGSVSTPEVVE